MYCAELEGEPYSLVESLNVTFHGLKGDCVLFHIPLHRSLAQTIASYVKIPSSEDPETLGSFFADVASSIVQSVTRPNQEVVLGAPVNMIFALPLANNLPRIRSAAAAGIAAAKTVRAVVEFPLRAIVAWRQIAEAR